MIQLYGLANKFFAGSIVPVVRGMFRNHWLPQGYAEYLPLIHGVNGSRVDAIRDPLFGREDNIAKEEPSPEQEVSAPRPPRPLPVSISVCLASLITSIYGAVADDYDNTA